MELEHRLSALMFDLKKSRQTVQFLNEDFTRMNKCIDDLIAKQRIKQEIIEASELSNQYNQYRKVTPVHTQS